MDNDLISRSALEKDLREYAERKHCNGQTELANGILKGISRVKAAPAVDAVEVVRCGECKHCLMYSPFVRDCCRHHGMAYVNEEDFCSYGERKPDEPD